MIEKKHEERTFAISAYFYGSSGLHVRLVSFPLPGIFLQKDSRPILDKARTKSENGILKIRILYPRDYFIYKQLN